MGSYRVGELARLGGTTVRNVRAYRERGLLAAPNLSGRTGWYDDTHLARLRLITRLLERGYTLANISELLTAWESGRPVGEVLGIEAVLTRPLAERPLSCTRAEAAAMLGLAPAELPLERLERLGLVELDEDALVVQLPGLLSAARDLVALGLPLTVVLDLAEVLVDNLDDVSRQLVNTVGDTLYGVDSEPATLATFDAATRRLLELADDAVTRIFRWSLERHVAGELGRAVERRLREPVGAR